jgi:prepilin-type N-terminal cleavage/methylation domain-containing protein
LRLQDLRLRDLRQQRGFSLVELLVIMAIMGILAGIAMLAFGRMQAKSGIERDAQTLYGNLMTVRLQALYTKTPRSVTFSGKSFSIYSSNVTSAAPIKTGDLSYPVVMNGGTNRIDFDSSGMMSGERTICLDPTGSLGENPGNVDSVDVTAAQVYMGKRQSGGACAPGFIEQK